MLFFRK